MYISTSFFKVTLLRRLSDPGKGLSDLELMVEKTTLKNQVYVDITIILEMVLNPYVVN